MTRNVQRQGHQLMIIRLSQERFPLRSIQLQILGFVFPQAMSDKKNKALVGLSHG
jgi:hypothetical protein